MEVLENIPLAFYTTFYIGGPSRYLIFAQDTEEVIEAVHFAKDKQLPYLIMGGGSNRLVSNRGYKGVTIRIESVGMDLVSETESEVVLKVASGEVWDDVVKFAVSENWWGIENLSHIPGFTGAFCVQNVGAYGQEASQVVKEVEVFDTQKEVITILQNSELDFGYRSSIFNSSQKGRYIILSTTLVLNKVGQPNLSYGDLAKEFSKQKTSPTLSEIRQAIIKIRNLKFPFPSEAKKGNSGSFFRGPLLNESEFELFLANFKASFPADTAKKLEAMKDKLKVPQGYKTPAAFLIELCGFKDFTIGGAKINPDQPAIILNYTGSATSTDVLQLYNQVSQEVEKKTSVKLGIEPDLIGFEKDELESFGIMV